MIAPARIAAYEALLAVARGQADLPSALARARAGLKDERDRALAGEIATGTLRWQAAFDHIVTAFANRRASRLDVEILAILRLSIFQLLHLDRVPASAVVNDAVQLARRAARTSAAGFTNALLRRVSRERGRLPLPARPRSESDRGAAIAYLSITLSHPEWLVERWMDRYGFAAAEDWARFDNEPAVLTLRANTLRNSRDDLAETLRTLHIETEPSRLAPAALLVRSGNPLLTSLAHTGAFVVQDEASQLVGEFVEARTGERILDACASPGGKTTQMAARMRDEGLIVGADVRGRRIALLATTVAQSGARCVRIVQADASRPLPFGAIFDAVLVDAPCSGLGTIRRDPDVRWRRTPDQFDALAAMQVRILRHAATVVRPGGRVIYSTCSSEPEENEAVVAAFLASAPEFSRVGDDLRTLPFRDRLEAFFAARLARSRGQV